MQDQSTPPIELLRKVALGEINYEWMQTIDEVHFYMHLPKAYTAKNMDIKIEPQYLFVGDKSKKIFFEGKLFSVIDKENSFWMIEDNSLHILLSKMRRAEIWESPIAGHDTLDPITYEKVKKRIMLERFQYEHPGFDFSGAQFSGNAPDPRSFLGGVSYDSL